MNQRAFPGAACGTDLVPGRPTRVRELAGQLGAVATGLLEIGRLLQRLGISGWAGPSAAAFAQLVITDLGTYQVAGAACAQAADHLQAHAGVLAAAQQQADDAVRLDLRATMSPDLGASDAVVEALRAQIVREVQDARSRVRGSAATAAEGLARVAALAPEPQGRLGRLASWATQQRRESIVGVQESAQGMALLTLRFSQFRLLTDPAGYADDVWAAGTGAWQSARDPLQAAQDLLDLETLRDSPARWLGRLAPEVALGVATGGTGVAARGPTAAVRLRSLAPTSGGRALRQAVRDTTIAGRGGLRARDLHSWSGERTAYGTVPTLGPVQHGVARVAARDSAWAEPRITSRVQLVADRLGGTRTGSEWVLKDPESLQRKVAGQVRSQAESIGPVLRATPDTVRYTLTFPPERYVAASLDTVGELRAQGFRLTNADSRWGSDRYQGLNLTLHDPQTGRLFEVQTHTPDSYRATRVTHRDYELFRDVGVPADVKEELRARIEGVYARVPRPDGVLGLGAHLAQHPPDAPALATAPQLLGTDPRRILGHVAATVPVAGAQPAFTPPPQTPDQAR